MTKVRPLHDRIVVQRSKGEEKSPGGIIIPDNAKEKPAEGEVLAVGTGKRLENGTRQEPDVKVGDRVLFGKYAGTEITGSEGTVILHEHEILGVVEG